MGSGKQSTAAATASPVVRSRVFHRPLGGPRARNRWLAGAAVFLALVYVAATAADEPLRRFMERRLNSALSGYRVRLGGFDLHPLTLSWELEDVTVVQEARPRPPLARVDEIRAGVQWRALLFGDLVADLALVRPRLHVTLPQAEAEVADEVPVQRRGWQEAVTGLHPFEINAFRVVDGDLTYVDAAPARPIRVRRLNLLINDIRNVRSRRGVLPSPIHADARLLGSATMRADGHADLLATPQPALALDFDVRELPLQRLQPAARHAALTIRGGTLSAAGRITVEADGRTEVALRDGTVDGLRADVRAAAPAAERSADATRRAAKQVTRSDASATTTVRADRFRLTRGEIAVVQEATDPPWRLFLSGLEIQVDDLDTRPDGPPGRLVLTGRFMDSGTTRVEAHLRNPARGPSFDAEVRVEDVDLTRLNDLLRATGGFDVAGGRLAVYSEIAVREGQIDGYVKPLFHDVEVHTRAQDADKGLLQEAYEGVVGGVAGVFENQMRDQVATRTSLAGPVDDPDASLLQIVLQLLRNAFIQAILPGLERPGGGG